MHELMQLIHDCLEEGPVRSKENRELAHHIHDISGYKRLVSLRLTPFAQVEQLLDHVAQELVLICLVHAP
jgi:hypothetical protein